jgi:hypothetical protein
VIVERPRNPDIDHRRLRYGDDFQRISGVDVDITHAAYQIPILTIQKDADAPVAEVKRRRKPGVTLLPRMRSLRSPNNA